MRKVVHRVAALLLVGLFVAGCSARRPAPEPAPFTAARHEEEPVYAIQTEPVPIAQQMEGQSDVIKLVVTDQGFEPAVIRSTVGGRVKLHLVNRGSQTHTLTMPRWGIFTRALAPGDENYIEFTPGEKGSWPFFSDPSGEAEPSVTGALEVE